MYAINRILLAVKDPGPKSSAALEKAAQLARALGAELQLFHAITETVYLDGAGILAQVCPELEQGRRDWYLRQLEELARGVRRRGIRVSTAVEWDFPECESIIRQAQRFEANLIMVQCHPAHRAPWLLRFTDWELLRISAAPVLLIKDHSAYRRPRILAALDPTHAGSKPADLDEEVIRYASTLADALHGAFHAVHAYEPPARVAPPAAGSHGSLRRTRAQRRSELRVLHERLASSADWTARCALQEALRSSGMQHCLQHVVASRPAPAIEEVSRDIGARIVVMGAVSRSGLDGLLIGNTAEKVLDRLPCDVLVVKPRGYRAPVARQPRGAQWVALPG